MEKKKLKKLTINKMTEFPVIGEQEQMQIKGGNPAIWRAVTAILAYISTSGGNDGDDTDGGNTDGSGNVIIQLGGEDNTVNINGEQIQVPDSIYIQAADSIGTNGVIYNPQGISLYYGQ